MVGNYLLEVDNLKGTLTMVPINAGKVMNRTRLQ